MIWTSVRSELVKLRRLSVLGGGAAMSAFTVIAVGVSMSRAVAGPPTRPDQLTIDRLQAVDGLHFLLNRGVSIIPIIASIIVAANIGAEYSQGTLRNILVREPRRLHLIGGKITALMGFNLLAGACAIALGVVAAYLIAPAKGVSTSLWTSAPGLNDLFSALGNLALAVVGYGILALFIALLFRSAAAAIGVAFAWFGIGENLLVAAYADLAKFLPGQLVDAVRTEGATIGQPSLAGKVSSSAVVISYQYALVGAGIWCAIALVGGALLLRRRDITS